MQALNSHYFLIMSEKFYIAGVLVTAVIIYHYLTLQFITNQFLKDTMYTQYMFSYIYSVYLINQ